MNIQAVEQALSEGWHGNVRLEVEEVIQDSGRSHVHRVRVLDAPTGSPETVIVKESKTDSDEAYDPSALHGRAERLFNDWAGLQFLGQELDRDDGRATIAPRWYAGKREIVDEAGQKSGFFVMGDLGQTNGLHDLLLGSDPTAARDGLIGLARTLGKMHALTIGKQAEFDRLRGMLGPQAGKHSSNSAPDSQDGPQARNRYEHILPTFQKMLADSDVTPRVGTESEVDALVERLNQPGSFLAYTHGDPCPDNCRVTADGVKLFDFEIGQYTHALIDGVYGWMHFPSCWCVNRLPVDIPMQMERVYQSELVKGCPEAADMGQFRQAVITGCAYWIISSSTWGSIAELTEKDIEWGISMVRQRRLVRFDIFAQLTEIYGFMEATGATIREIAAKLRKIWPVEADQMPTYPAF